MLSHWTTDSSKREWHLSPKDWNAREPAFATLQACQEDAAYASLLCSTPKAYSSGAKAADVVLSV
jgi:hypothetical protein